MIKGTLCYIVTEGKILLIKKKKGLGEGLFNGPGGKIEDGETPDTAAVREFVEETGVMPLNPEHCGTVAFYFGQKEKPDWMVHVFKATNFKGEPVIYRLEEGKYVIDLIKSFAAGTNKKL